MSTDVNFKSTGVHQIILKKVILSIARVFYAPPFVKEEVGEILMKLINCLHYYYYLRIGYSDPNRTYR